MKLEEIFFFGCAGFIIFGCIFAFYLNKNYLKRVAQGLVNSVGKDNVLLLEEWTIYAGQR